MPRSKSRFLREQVCAIVAFACMGTTVCIAQSQLFAGLYQYNNGRIVTMGLDGSDPQLLFTAEPFPASDWLICGVDIDNEGHVYWNHGSSPGYVRRANLDGTNQTTLASGLKYPRGCAVDAVGGKVYWTEAPTAGNTAGIIRRQNLDGTGSIEEVYRVPDYSSQTRLGRPTVDAVNGYLYFIVDCQVKRMNVDGPPFTVKTIADGASTGTRLIVDVANRHMYWIDSDTISDCLVRVDFNNENFTVLYDGTPDLFASSGLGDMAIDYAGGHIYLADEIVSDGEKNITMCNMDGSSPSIIYEMPSGAACVALTLNTPYEQALEDCNGNGVSDRLDVANGYSEDCNENGIPDECENDPCEEPPYLLDQDVDDDTVRAMGDTGTGNVWEVFQPFVVPAGGWHIGEIWLNGRTECYNALGFTATIHPDNGAGMFDETQSLGSWVMSPFRYSISWLKTPVDVTLPEGQYWLHLQGNSSYHSGLYCSTSGISGGYSRRNGTTLYTSSNPIALRLLPWDRTPGDLDGNGCVNLSDLAELLSNYGLTSGVTYEDGDIDGDGDVDISDLAELLGHYGEGCN